MNIKREYKEVITIKCESSEYKLALDFLHDHGFDIYASKYSIEGCTLEANRTTKRAGTFQSDLDYMNAWKLRNENIEL